jgi:hypothetical protein
MASRKLRGYYMTKKILVLIAVMGSALTSYAQVRSSVNAVTIKNAMACVDTSGTPNTITCSTFQGLPAYVTNEIFFVSMANTTTGATTININGLGAKNVTKNGLTAIGNNDLLVNGTYAMKYDGTEFVVVGSGMVWPAGGAGIPNYSGSSTWNTTYNASNTIPANFISALPYVSTTLTSAHINVGNGSNVATSVALSGDCTLANTGAITCTKSSGTAFGTGAFATIANYAALTGATFTGGITAPTMTDSGLTSGNCVQAGAGGLLATASAPCSASALSGQTAHGLTIATTASTSTSSTTVPSAQGQFSVGYTIACGSSTAVDPSITQLGSTPRDVTGTTSTDTILCTDNLNPVIYNGSVAVTVTLPTPTTLGNTGFSTKLVNNTSGSATALTVNTTTLLFDRNSTTTLTIPQDQECTITADGSVWDTSCHDAPLVAGSNITLTRGQYGLTIASSSSGTATINGVSCGTCNLGTLNDTNGNASLLTGTTASAVDQVTVTNAAAGGIPSLMATGADTNIPMSLSGKGTGTVNLLTSVLYGGSTTSTAQEEISTAGNTILNNGGRLSWSATSAVNGSLDTQLARKAAGLVSVSGSTSGDLQGSLILLGYQNAVPNNGTTATVLNKLAIYSAGTAIVALTSTTHGVIGVVMSGAGTTGNAGVIHAGNASLIFDGAITQGDWFIPSTTTGGDGHDSTTASTAAPPTSCVGQIVAATNASPGSTPQAVWMSCQ